MIENTLKIKNPFSKTERSFNGTLKPLGAWGGDFFMAISKNGSKYIKNHFEKQGQNVVFDFQDLMLKK